MRDGDRSGQDGDVGFLLRWGALIAVMAVCGLFLAARAADDYTAVVGMLFVGFAVLLAFRMIVRLSPGDAR